MLDLALALALSGAPAPALPPPAAISAKLTEEDGRPEILATVRSGDKPLANAGVAFRLVRSFGDLELGQDTTLDDGTAAAPFPKGLGPDAAGGWTFKVALTSPETVQGQEAVFRILAPGRPPADLPEPRELWARRAPWSLLAAVAVLLGSAWGAFAFAARQIWRIKQGG